MTIPEMEIKLAQYLDTRWIAVFYADNPLDEIKFYIAACNTIAQIGDWELRDDGTHCVKLD